MRSSLFLLLVPVLLAFSLPVFSQGNLRVQGLDSAAYPEDDYWTRKKFRVRNKPHRDYISYALYTGSKGSVLKVSDFNDHAFDRKWPPIAGGAVNASLPRFSRRLFLTFEANYSKSYYIGTSEVHTNNQVQRKDYEFRLSTFQVPISLRLNFKSSGNTVYVKAGHSFNWYNSGKLKWVDEVETNREIITSVGTIDLKLKKQGTFQLGAGYKHSFMRSIKIYGEVRYERAMNILDPAVLESESSFRNLYFLIGLEY